MEVALEMVKHLRNSVGDNVPGKYFIIPEVAVSDVDAIQGNGDEKNGKVPELHQKRTDPLHAPLRSRGCEVCNGRSIIYVRRFFGTILNKHLNGRIAYIIGEKLLPSGIHSIVFSEVLHGTCLVKMVADGRTGIQKMILFRRDGGKPSVKQAKKGMRHGIM